MNHSQKTVLFCRFQYFIFRSRVHTCSDQCSLFHVAHLLVLLFNNVFLLARHNFYFNSESKRLINVLHSNNNDFKKKPTQLFDAWTVKKRKNSVFKLIHFV